MTQPTLAAQMAPQPVDPASSISAYRWTLAWIVLAIMLWLFNKLQIGKTISYYAVILTIFFLVLTQYQAITTLLSPFSNYQASAAQGSNNAA